MTLPLGGGDVTPADWWLFPGANSSASNIAATGVAAMPGRTQTPVRAALAARAQANGRLDQVTTIYGQYSNLPPPIADLVSWATFGDFRPNLLKQHNFPTKSSVQAPGWSWDGSVSHSALGFGGSATVIADGTDHDFPLNQVRVVSGQNVKMLIRSQWMGLVSTGTPISLIAYGYTGGVLQDSVVVDYFTALGSGSSDEWYELDGVYVVPDNIDTVAMDLHVGATATAGQVWFSDGFMTKNLMFGSLPMELTQGASEHATANDNWLQNFMQKVADAFQPGNGPGADPTTTGIILQSHKREFTQIAAGVAELKADIAANNNSGVSYTATVSDYGTSFPSVLTNVYTTGSGTVSNDGNTLGFSNNTGKQLFLFNSGALLTDYFEVSMVVPAQAGQYGFGYQNRSLYFIGRSNAAGTEMVLGRLNGNVVTVGGVKSGGGTIASPTLFGSGSGSGPTSVTVNPGVYMTLRGGTIAGVTQCELLVNRQIVATFTDSAGASIVDSAHRWTGIGIENQAVDFINRSPTISNILANDNTPAPVTGSGGQMTRVATSNVTISSGAHALSTSFFDTPGPISPDLTPDLTNGSFTVSVASWYHGIGSILAGAFWPTSGMRLVIYVNGAPVRNMGRNAAYESNSGGGTIPPKEVSGTWAEYLQVGDVVSLGYNSSAGVLGALSGDAAGLGSYFTIMRGANSNG